jgi:predicted phosphoribosyltransferase
MKENVTIVSLDREAFKDRIEAGEELGKKLSDQHHPEAVVLGIPRGGMVVAQEIARCLKADIDIVLTRKLAAPGNPEYAMGALDEKGHVILNEQFREHTPVNELYLESEKDRQIKQIRHRKEFYRKVHAKRDLKGKSVILTDDGAATGATMQSAILSVREQNPMEVIAALPVAPEPVLDRFAEMADRVVCLNMPVFFSAVGQFYIHFTQVEDDTVLEILKESELLKKT